MRRGVIITGLACLLLAAPASGADRPPFAHAYVGTVTGMLRTNGASTRGRCAG